jgi:hypothetical protein
MEKQSISHKSSVLRAAPWPNYIYIEGERERERERELGYGATHSTDSLCVMDRFSVFKI